MKCLGTFLTNTNYMLCKKSGSLSMCTPKNKKNEMSGYIFDEYKLYVVQNKLKLGRAYPDILKL